MATVKEVRLTRAVLAEVADLANGARSVAACVVGDLLRFECVEYVAREVNAQCISRSVAGQTCRCVVCV